jgi:hypothetical protein
MKKSKIEKALLECYIEAYKNSTPSADFNELVANAKVDEDGRKVIEYKKYKCKHETMSEILEKKAKKYKLNERQIKVLNFNFWLGCSPMSEKYM